MGKWTDLFALGHVAFEMVSGRRLFQSNDFWDLSQEVSRWQPPEVQEELPDVSEEYRQVILDYQQVAEKVIRRYGGHVAQYLGDGLLVYFGYPKGLRKKVDRTYKLV